MIPISDNITLRTIQLKDFEEIFSLMSKIYPPVYNHLWDDNGSWYINEIYNQNNLKAELSDKNGLYYFVEYNSETVGILRLIDNCSPTLFKNKKGLKLHRIYLSPIVHGNNVGTTIINWVKNKARILNKDIVWLEAMDSQTNALRFYKKLGFITFEQFEFGLKKMAKKHRGMYRMWCKINHTTGREPF